MCLDARELINTISPALRALLADGTVLKVVRFEEGGAESGGTMTFEPPADGDTAGIVGALRRALDDFGGSPERVFVPGLGTFKIGEHAGSSVVGRAKGKVAVVTGAARGFGLAISQSIADQGGCVALTDINVAGVKEAAAEINGRLGAGRAIALSMDVTRSDTVSRAVDQVVLTYGGFDVFVSNAGILRAESVANLSEEDFDFVTEVNYKGYFICVKSAAPVMAVQHMAKPDYWSDIIQINSKSGLAGSNRNSAYAGSKFGGIGLTQSFALELVGDGIKVNAVCPGNFFDGPLWSDPDNGLCISYLRAGKIPGAKTMDDVQRAYEAKVPMGRGCTAADVINAIYYLMDQQYETGQALPVTGGQTMLA